MTALQPWEEEGSPWKSEAAFVSWVRGILRKGWSRHPIKLEFLKRNRKRIVNPNPKNRTRFPEIWGQTCAICKQDKAQSECEVDHISATGGTFKSLDDAVAYMRHLFHVNFSNIRIVCKPCHKIITHAQKTGASFDEAKLQKAVIEKMKQDKASIVEFCIQNGYNERSLTNATKRREAVEAILRRSTT